MLWLRVAISLTLLGAQARAAKPFDSAAVVFQQGFDADADRDYDGMPDGWSRRAGPEFPAYVEVGIDRSVGQAAAGSLRMTPDGAAAVIYAPPLSVDDARTYTFGAAVHTEGLRHSAAVCSVSVLDAQMRRIARQISVAVSGTHLGWVPLQIGPLEPRPGQRYLVLGCHLVPGDGLDLAGGAWFDDLQLVAGPTLWLTGGSASHFRRPGEAAEIEAAVTGLEPNQTHRLELALQDMSAGEIARSEHSLVAGGDFGLPVLTQWRVPGVAPGFYRVQATLRQGTQVVAQQETTFVVADPPPPRSREFRSPFAWSLSHLPEHLESGDFAAIAAEGGAGYIKLPLWQHAAHRLAADRDTAFVQALTVRGIATVGVLDPPPVSVWQRAMVQPTAISEVFAMPPKVWSAALEPLVARHGAQVRLWQLGRDDDRSFPLLPDPAATVAALQTEFRRIGRTVTTVLPWPADTTRRPVADAIISTVPEATPPTFPNARGVDSRLWQSLRGESAGAGASSEKSAADLVRRMIAARAGGAAVVSYADLFSSEAGLLTPRGEPTPLYLPWRSTAVALGSLADVGALPLPGGSQNRIFADDESATLALWNDVATSETVVPGGHSDVRDAWGRAVAVSRDAASGRVTLPVGPVPVFVVGASAPLLKWQLASRLQSERLDSRYGPQPQAVLGENPFPQGVGGTVSLRLPAGWTGEPQTWPLRLAEGERFRLPFQLTLPPDVSLGPHAVGIAFQIQGDQPYQFEVRREVIVGLGDIELTAIDVAWPDGHLEVVQTLINRTEPPQELNFRCSLFVPGNQRQRQYVVKLGRGQDTKHYRLPNAAALAGQELWLRVEQEPGRRVLNYKWTVGATPAATVETVRPGPAELPR